jgi:isovaleryl-CoA dehydrogenase
MLRRVISRTSNVAVAQRWQSTSTIQKLDIYNPTEEHRSLRTMLREFVEKEVDPQALEFNRLEKFNVPLFKKLGELGLLGITVDPEYGGSGMDATAAVIAHGECFRFC